jgi:catechol 2,3-dioxygenase-like lactoylglutathione lyase family enzyme
MSGDVMNQSGSYDLGGVQYPRPFKIKRFGHFGYYVDDVDACVHFYTSILGFKITDILDLSSHPDIGNLLDDSRAFFLTNGNDHHALVIAHSSARAFDDEPGPEDVTLNQITWQVGSLRETVDAAEYFRGHSITVRRQGRDMPGSNWHTYFQDPDGHMVELYYGMEQIGWNLLSKPFAMHSRAFLESPALPQINEAQELRNAQRDGIDIFSGYAVHDPVAMKLRVTTLAASCFRDPSRSSRSGRSVCSLMTSK